jgi:hypothetical protein
MPLLSRLQLLQTPDDVGLLFLLQATRTNHERPYLEPTD